MYNIFTGGDFLKIKVIEDKEHDDKSLTIITHTLTPEIQKFIDSYHQGTIKASFRKEDVILKIESILFFETDQNIIYAHNDKQAFETKYRLYELEKELPEYFIRISKSTIVNVNEVSAIENSFSASRKLSFFYSSKVVYVSRKYFPILKEKLNERSL